MMSTRKYHLLAIPADEWQELNDILKTAGYKTGGGFGSQRGQAIMDLLRKAAPHSAPVLSDARLLEARLSANWHDVDGVG